MVTERSLPQNIDAECGVLGSLLIDPEAVVLVASFLSSEDFYRDAHRTLYEVIIQLHEHRIPADYITVCDMLEQQNKLEDMGGASYITSLINCVPTSGNVEYYGYIVSRTALLRRLIAAGGQIVTQAYEDDEQSAALTLERAEQIIFEISQRHNSSIGNSSHVRDLLATYIERLDQTHAQRGTVVGVPTGFTDLDRLLGGLQRSDFLVLAGRPGTGKSSLALSIAHNAARLHRRKVGFFSLEMSKEQIIQRLLAMDSGVDQQRLRTGWVEDDEWERIMASTAAIAETDIWIDDTSSISTIQLRSKARRWILEHGIDLIIIDYLQLLQASTSNRQRFENRTQEVGMISRSLKGLARELNIPILALAQLSRAVESRSSKIPQLSDLRESGSIEADADVVMFIYRDDVYNPASERPNTADIIIAKHRNGPVGEVTLAFDKSQTRFRDIIVSPGEEMVFEEIQEEFTTNSENNIHRERYEK
jgi:replicative DNA helicase